MIRPLVLASTSRIRRTLMDECGFRYQVDAPNVDEETIAAPLLDPSARALALASAKAAVVLSRHPSAVVVAADQVGVLDDGTFLDKPRSRDHHIAQLQAMAGARHRFFPAVVVACSSSLQAAVVPVQVWFHPLSGDVIQRYIDSGEGQGSCGGYWFEAGGRDLIDRIDGDEHGVLGLPMVVVTNLLRMVGSDDELRAWGLG